MSEESKAVARRWMNDLWNQGNLLVADEIIAPTYAVHDSGTPGRTGGIEGEKQAVRMYRAVFPDLQFTIEDMVGEGDRVAVAYTARGTHQGELMGVPATDRQVVVTLISILRIGNGKITEQRINWDTLGMLRQLGIVPSSGEGRA